MVSRSCGYPDHRTVVEEEKKEAHIMTQSNEENFEEGSERGIIEARLAEVMDGQEASEMEQEPMSCGENMCWLSNIFPLGKEKTRVATY